MTTKPTFTQSSPIVIPTITNDKLPCAPPDLFVVFTDIPASAVLSGDAFSVTLEVRNEAGIVDTTFVGPVTLSLGQVTLDAPPPDGSLVLSGTLTVNAVAGVATYNNVIATLGGLASSGTFTLIGGGTGLTNGESGPIDVGFPT